MLGKIWACTDSEGREAQIASAVGIHTFTQALDAESFSVQEAGLWTS
jgi:hypothetical protein